MSNSPKILIVGAGAAGLSAASRLIENGFTNVKLFEAEGRIGGRIHSVKLGESYADLGAQWCHGEEGNIVYDMIKDLDLVTPSFNTYDNNTFYSSNGKIIDKSIAEPLQEFYFTFGKSGEEMPGNFGENFIKRYYK